MAGAVIGSLAALLPLGAGIGTINAQTTTNSGGGSSTTSNVAHVLFQIQPTILPAAPSGVGYTQSLSVPLASSNVSNSFNWMLIAGGLPPGLTLAVNAPAGNNSTINTVGKTQGGNTATITGIPTVPGDYTFTLGVTNGANVTTQSFTISVRSSTDNANSANNNINNANANGTNATVPSAVPAGGTGSVLGTSTIAAHSTTPSLISNLDAELMDIRTRLMALQQIIAGGGTGFSGSNNGANPGIPNTGAAPSGTIGSSSANENIGLLYGPGFFTSALTSDMSLGSTGQNVKLLQQFLNAHGSWIASAGEPGSPGNETEYFGRATEQALQLWQVMNDATPANGVFNAATRNAIAALNL